MTWLHIAMWVSWLAATAFELIGVATGKYATTTDVRWAERKWIVVRWLVLGFTAWLLLHFQAGL